MILAVICAVLFAGLFCVYLLSRPEPELPNLEVKFKVPVFTVTKLRPHPNADTLSLVEFEGQEIAVKSTSVHIGQLAIYIPVDSVVPVDAPPFKFLDKGKGKPVRLNAKQLRGIYSEGLVLPLHEVLGIEEFLVESSGWQEGDDIAQHLGVTKYVEPVPVKLMGEGESPPTGVPTYGLEQLYKFRDGIEKLGVDVVVTEKIHGCNARFVYTGHKFYQGSHNCFWKSGPNVWSRMAQKYELEAFLQECPDMVVFGEVWGDVQDLKYGKANGELAFSAFDVFDMKAKRFLTPDDARAFCDSGNIPFVPERYRGPYDHAKIMELANETTVVGTNLTQISEGVVVRPVEDISYQSLRWAFADLGVIRPVLKVKSQAYMLRHAGTELK